MNISQTMNNMNKDAFKGLPATQESLPVKKDTLLSLNWFQNIGLP